jgi:hypothetical protein
MAVFSSFLVVAAIRSQAAASFFIENVNFSARDYADTPRISLSLMRSTMHIYSLIPLNSHQPKYLATSTRCFRTNLCDTL